MDLATKLVANAMKLATKPVANAMKLATKPVTNAMDLATKPVLDAPQLGPECLHLGGELAYGSKGKAAYRCAHADDGEHQGDDSGHIQSHHRGSGQGSCGTTTACLSAPTSGGQSMWYQPGRRFKRQARRLRQWPVSGGGGARAGSGSGS
ncbi:hypothetical protein [Candidatus Palauibacter sp.]|uniref:hypothetical protein n=1 Tax=Candidatus Palauibacter sp. TaxID=3101350 RepID=UPI003AF25C55